ncbi:hypothetical protein BV22DRAFT_1043490 [Leucogyrophana mollusca]|uniref:Uncharacterized protein n=1 Tax=Leucogyrophana mollusca TaxID=85980 RepID=A0ACB8BZ27_9AGAM|nr:hypothetical protein BV22DRAFT_1043490 [Leucogyrophana mollusca]
MFSEAPTLMAESFQYPGLPAFTDAYAESHSLYPHFHEFSSFVDRFPTPNDLQPRSHSAPPSFLQEDSISDSDLVFMYQGPPGSSLASPASSCDSLTPYPRISITSPSDAEIVEPAKGKHIPRPPNAFMLYRSDFLKKGIIPPHVERRQQNLSRVAGECWNLLPDEEKAQWHAKAAEAHAAHYAKYPNYKFRPTRGRGAARAKDKSRQTDDGYEKERIRTIREKYTQIGGPAVGPPRSRKAKTHSRKTIYDDGLFAAMRTPLPPSISSSPTLSPLRLPSLHVPFSEDEKSEGGGMRPSYPVSPHVTDKAGGHGLELDLSRPSSAAGSDTSLSELICDLDITPTAANFQQHAISPSDVAGGRYDTLLGLGHLRLPHCKYPSSSMLGMYIDSLAPLFDHPASSASALDFTPPNHTLNHIAGGPSYTPNVPVSHDWRNSWMTQSGWQSDEGDVRRL